MVSEIPRALLEMFADLPGDKCLYSTPSYAVRLAEVAAEVGIDPQSLNIKKGIYSGEAGLQVPGYRQKIDENLGYEHPRPLRYCRTGVPER